jgi:anti-sigma B factor antagonist
MDPRQVAIITFPPGLKRLQYKGAVLAHKEQIRMKITEGEKNGIAVFELDGRIDSEGAVELDEVLQKAVDAGKYKMVLDMSKVQYINSAALRTLADIITRNREHNGDLRLAALPPKVRRVLQIVGFDKFSSLHDSVDSALADF